MRVSAPTIRIGRREIGPGQATFVIAEAGVNHNGLLDRALELVDAAARSGADAVKFQTWQTDLIVTATAPAAAYQREQTGSTSQADMLRALELAAADFQTIKAHAEERGILFLSTPDESASATVLNDLGVPAFKIGSGEVDNLPFLRFVGAFGKPVILSTGMSTLDEVRAAVGALRDAGCREIAILHCVTSYPAPLESLNLRAMATLRETFGTVVGYSDHTVGPLASVAAVAMGASVIEKHFTLDRTLPGPDHAASMEPDDFSRMVAEIRAVERALGDGVKVPATCELENRELVRKVLVASRDLAAGHRLGADDLIAKRAGGGISPTQLARIVGRTLRTALRADEPVRDDGIE